MGSILTRLLPSSHRAVSERRTEIERLSARNRIHRDPDVERRLVRLRYDAFRAAGAPGRPDEPQPVVEDRFPGALIPEVPRDQLTADVLRSAIAHHGSLLVLGLVGDEEVERLRQDIDRAFDAFDARQAGAVPPELDGWYEPFEHRTITDEDRVRKRSRGNILAAESPAALADLVDVMDGCGMGALSREFLGEPPAILARKVTLRRMPHNFGGGWHQDGAFMGKGIRSLNVWLSLTHCGDDAPGLDVVARRLNDLVRTGNGAYAEWGVKAEDAEAVGEGCTVRPIFEAGDALLFDHLLLHRTGTDPGMVHGRYAIETWFFAPSTYGAMVKADGDGYRPRDQVPLVY